MVEWTGLENRRTVRRTVGSNPTPTAFDEREMMSTSKLNDHQGYLRDSNTHDAQRRNVGAMLRDRESPPNG